MLCKRWHKIRLIFLRIIVLVVLFATLFPITFVQASSNLTVDFEVVRETPVDVTIRATITNLDTLPAKSLAMETLLQDLSIPISSLNQIRIEQVTKQSYQVAIPIYSTVTLTDQERVDWMVNYLFLEGITLPIEWSTQTLDQKIEWFMTATGERAPPTEEQRITSDNQETRYREVKENFKDWYFNGLTPKMTATIIVPSNQDNEYGFGDGKLVLDITINTGLQIKTDSKNKRTGWGSKGVLVLNINGNIYKDLTNSSWWDNNWNYRNVLSANMSGISSNFIDYPTIFTFNTFNFNFSLVGDNTSSFRFIDKDDTTSLPFLITSVDGVPTAPGATTSISGATSNMTAVVRVPQWDADTVFSDYIYVYYGNATANDAQSTANQTMGVSDTDIVLNDPLYGLIGDNWTSPDTYEHLNTVTGAIWTPQGRSFNGIDDWINLGQIAPPAAAMTVEGWVRVDTNPLNDAWVGKDGDTPNNRGWYFGFGDAPNYYAELIVSENGTNQVAVQATTPLVLDTWTHFVGVWNGTQIFIYMDGVVASGTTSCSAMFDGNYQLGIGNAPPYTGFLNSDIGEVRIYNRALTPAEIQQNYLATKWRYGDNIYYGAEDPSPTMVTHEASSVGMDKDGVISGNFVGEVTSLGGVPSANVSFQYGLNGTLTHETNIQSANATGNYTASIPTYLVPGETYQYRAKGTNTEGTAYGDNVTFALTMPTITTNEATNTVMTAGGTSATLNGAVSDMGIASSSYVWFEWGYDTSYGTTVGSTSVIGTGAESTSITHFNPDATVHFRFGVKNGDTTEYGSDQSFLVASAGGSSPAYANFNLANTVLPILAFVVIIVAIVWLLRRERHTGLEIILWAAIIIIIGVYFYQALQDALNSLW